MSFDLCEHKMRSLIIRVGVEIRKIKGLPEEKNITVIYNETAILLGITPIQLMSDKMNHLPTPEESVREHPEFAQICPKCGKKSYFLQGICRSCKDSENGKYKTMFQCFKCKYQQKSEEPIVVWLGRLGIDFATQSKQSLGIVTITDKGEK